MPISFAEQGFGDLELLIVWILSASALQDINGIYGTLKSSQCFRPENIFGRAELPAPSNFSDDINQFRRFCYLSMPKGTDRVILKYFRVWGLTVRVDECLPRGRIGGSAVGFRTDPMYDRDLVIEFSLFESL